MRFLFPITGRRRLALLWAGVLVLGVGIGCESREPPDSYVARVGSHYLTQDDLDRKLASMGPTPDSTRARQQLVDQWVTRMLLYREAERRNLQSTEAVQRQLERQRRSILIAALKDRIYEEGNLTPSSQDVRTYFEDHKDELRIREPYVRVRYLATRGPDSAREVRQTLRTLPPTADSTWHRLVRTHAADTLQARRLSGHYLPESRLDQALPFFSERLDALQDGDTTPIVEHDTRYHVLRLDRRIQAGTEPKLEWLEPQIRRRLRIRARKQMYKHEVQRLRNRAQTNGALETP